MTVRVEIGRSSPVSMNDDEARNAIKKHLHHGHRSTVQYVVLDDKKWVIEIQMSDGRGAQLTFCESAFASPVKIALT